MRVGSAISVSHKRKGSETHVAEPSILDADIAAVADMLTTSQFLGIHGGVASSSAYTEEQTTFKTSARPRIVTLYHPKDTENQACKKVASRVAQNAHLKIGFYGQLDPTNTGHHVLSEGHHWHPPRIATTHASVVCVAWCCLPLK